MSNFYIPIHLILILFSFFTLQAQERVLTHSRAKVMLGNQDLMKLAAAGIDITHGHFEKDCCFTSDFSNIEIEKMRERGFEVLIEIEDVSMHYQMQNLFPKETELVSRSNTCDQNKKDGYPIPNNFELGSMGGFHTYAEIMDILDLMHILYPHLISFREPIGDYKTYFGRPIYYVKISNAPELEQVNKPKVLHTALHHAREPISVSQLLYFMWYLLENYDKDPNVKGLVDAVELYLVPVINVDGYMFNQQNFPSGGGMHRKNRRVLAMGNIGVDLNRNYDYQWGFDEVGSSPEDWSDVYRGPSPASEPEVKAIKHLCGQKGFDIAFNHHSYGNALLYPFGYAEVAVPDQETFFSLSSEMTSHNGYDFGRPWEVPAVGYRTNGSSDDWMYGESLSKPPIYAFTPEIGSSNQGFWPHRDDILSLCQSTLHMNISSLSLVNTYGSITEMTPELIGSMDDQLIFKLKRTGLKDGAYNIKVKALSNNVSMLSTESTHQLLPNASLETAFQYELSNDITLRETVRFASELTMGDIVLRDTIEKTYMGEKTVRFSDNGLTMDNWSTGVSTWGIDEADYFTPSTSISDSPGGNYQPQTDNTMRLFQGVDLREAEAAFLTFRAKWAIEPGADYLTISASDNGFVFQPLCGKFTKPSNKISIAGTPIYDGFKSDWVLEVMDLKDYLGGNLFLELTLSSDQSREFDGFYIDDIQVITFDETSSIKKHNQAQISSQVYPNPGSDKLFFELEHRLTRNHASTKLELYNMLGELVVSVPASDLSTKVLEVNVDFLNAGFYVYRIVNQNQTISTGRISLVK